MAQQNNRNTSVAERVDTRARAEAILSSVQDIITTALPSTVKPEAFRDVFLTAAKKEPKIFNATTSSVQQALIAAARSGLMPDGKMAALVPFKNKAGELEVQFIVMVMGYIHLFKKHAGVHSMTVNIVRDNEPFTYIEGFETTFEHHPNVFAENRGEKVGAYAIFRDKDGDVMHLEIMSKAEINKARSVSKMSGGPWRDWEDEMWRKTVVRRAAKYLPLTDEAQRILDNEDANTIDLDLPRQPSLARSEDYNPMLDAARAVTQEEGRVVDSEDPPFDEDGVVLEGDSPQEEAPITPKPTRKAHTEKELDDAWNAGLDAKEAGLPRTAPESYDEELRRTFESAWDKAEVKKPKEEKPKAPKADDVANVDSVIKDAKAKALDGADRDAPSNLTEAQQKIWLEAYDAQVADANENG